MNLRLSSAWGFLLAFLLSGALSACGGGSGDAAVPSVGSQTAVPPASGAQPPVPSKAATLTWTAPLENIDGSVLVGLSGFKIYYGQDPGSLNSTISVTNASVSTYMVENLSAGTWYFGVSAINGQGVESPLSNIASKTIT